MGLKNFISFDLNFFLISLKYSYAKTITISTSKLIDSGILTIGICFPGVNLFCLIGLSSIIYVINDKSGKPNIKFSNKVNNLIAKKFKTKNFDIFLSLSDEKNYSIAFVVIQKK